VEWNNIVFSLFYGIGKESEKGGVMGGCIH
jgi:hypothetical protein